MILIFEFKMLHLQKIAGMTGICQQQHFWQAENLQAAEIGKNFRDVTIFSI